jgi:POTRA domain-containing protein, ftsQ-type
MAKQAKEKENLDFFYLGEKKVELNKSKNKNVVKSKNKTKTVSPKKKSKNKKNEPMDLDNEIIIGLKRIEDKPVKKQKSTKKRNSNIKSQNSKDKNKSKITKNKPRNSNTIKDRKQTSNKSTNVKNNKNVSKNNLRVEEINISDKLYDDEQIKGYESPKEKEKKKKKRKKIFKTIKILMMIFILIGGVTFFLLSPIFNIKNINVSGNSKISSEEILSLSQLRKDENIFKINKQDTREKVKQNAYIDTVEIKRTLPDVVTIVVTERTATYQISFSNMYMLINNQGYMLETTELDKSMPLIVGVTTKKEEIKPGNRLCSDDLEKLEDVLRILESAKSNNLDKLINKIDITNKDDYVVEMKKEKKIVHLGDVTNLALKMLYVSDIINKEKDEGEIFVNTDLENKGAIFRKKV